MGDRVSKLRVLQTLRSPSSGFSRNCYSFMAHGVIVASQHLFCVRCVAYAFLIFVLLMIVTDSFYKNIVLYMTQFWVCAEHLWYRKACLTVTQYSFFNNFSGQVAYESWTLTFYNVLFTLLPPLVIGVFDQNVSARMLDRYPQLYIHGQKNEFFSKTAFWLWVTNALYHSLVSATNLISYH